MVLAAMVFFEPLHTPQAMADGYTVVAGTKISPDSDWIRESPT